MGLFNKKESIPEIPSAPALPELPRLSAAPDKKTLPELPSFPVSPKNENLNQEMVKSAVVDQSPPMEQSVDLNIPEVPVASPAVANPVTENVVSESSFSQPAGLTFPTPTVQPKEVKLPLSIVAKQAVPKEVEPIFVRIDKFQTSQSDFNDIRNKVGEIEVVLQRIKEVKVREEEELKSWTEDVEKIKLKLSQIDADIFSQI